MSEHADAIAAHAKAIQQLAVVKGIVDAGGGGGAGDFGRQHKDLMVTGRESVNELLDVFIGALKLVRRDEAEKRALATAQFGLFPDPHSEPADVADLHRDAEPAAATEIYWQILKHTGYGDRYAVQVRRPTGDEAEPQVVGFVKLGAVEEIEPDVLPGLEYDTEDTITIEFLNDPQEPFGVEGDETAAETETEPETKAKKSRKKK